MIIVNDKKEAFFHGVSAERKLISARRKIGKMLVSLYQNHQINTPLLPTIEIDTGIVEQSKKFGISNHSLHKYLGKRIFPVGNGRKSIILGADDMKDIQAVLDLYYHWKTSNNQRGSRQTIENVFFHLFMTPQ